jgi:hypothetical protein
MKAANSDGARCPTGDIPFSCLSPAPLYDGEVEMIFEKNCVVLLRNMRSK